MALHEEMVRHGHWLFRWRSYLPLLLLGPMLLAMGFSEVARPSKPLLAWGVGCLLVSLAGFAVRIATTGFAPNGTSGRNTRRQKAKTLNTTGLYSVVRHPLYLGNFLIWLGIALFAQLGWLTLLLVLAFWLYYERIILAEEEFLRQKFTEEFDVWAARTPTLVPRFSQWIWPATPFSWRRVLRKENSGLLGIAAAYFVLAAVRDLASGRPVSWESPWAVLLVLAGLTYGVLRTLKRRTSWLRTADESLELLEPATAGGMP